MSAGLKMLPLAYKCVIYKSERNAMGRLRGIGF